MKIKVNYDLLSKIKESKKGISLSKIYKARLRYTILSAPLLVPLFIMYPSEKEKIIPFYIGWESLWLVIDYLIEKSFKNLKKKTSKMELDDLIDELSKLGVLTNYELLQSSKVIDTNYKITLNENKIPVIKEEKYINVNLSNGYNETILQEHNIMSRYYDISVKEIEKKKEFKLAKNKI